MLFSSSFFTSHSFQQWFGLEQLLEQKTWAAQIFLPLYNSLISFSNSINWQLHSLPPSILTSLKVLRACSSYLQLKCLFFRYPCWSCPCCITRCLEISSFPAAPSQSLLLTSQEQLKRKTIAENKKQKLRTKSRAWEISGWFSMIVLQGAANVSD